MTFLITVIAIILTYMIYSAINTLIVLLVGPRFGFEVGTIMFWGGLFTKTDGKWVRTRGKFKLFPQAGMKTDTSGYLQDDPEKAVLPLDITALAIHFLVTVGLFFAFLATPETGSPINWRSVMLWVFISGAGFLFMFICLFIKSHFLKKTGLEAYNRDLTAMLRRGEYFPESWMKMPEELPFRGYSQRTKIIYYGYYFLYMLWSGQYDRLYLPMHETAVYLRNRTYVMSDTHLYYDVVFYYSRFEFDPSAAQYFMDRIRSVLAADPDANAKRVLAYYAYGVENDREKARYFINEALAVVDKFSLPGMERELERRLVTELDERLASEGVI